MPRSRMHTKEPLQTKNGHLDFTNMIAEVKTPLSGVRRLKESARK